MREIDWNQIIVILFSVVAAALYLYPLRHRDHFWLRFTVSLLVSATLCSSMEMVLGISVFMHIVKALLKQIVLSISIYVCVKETKSAALYVGIWSAITADFVFGLWKIGTGLLNLPRVPLIACYVILYLILHLTLANIMPDKGTYRIGPRQLGSAIGIWIVFEFLYFVIRDSLIEHRDLYLWLAILLAQCYCVTMLYLQTELFKKSAMEKELLTLNLLWQKQKNQYDLNKENFDLINRKCHDLKHQIAVIRGMQDDASKEHYLREIESSIQIYDATVKTGNEVLNTILTEKSLYCEENGIKINSVVDGSSLGFIDTVDLYTILGNAIDNSVEGVRQFEEAEKRLIDISIYTRNQFLIIHIVNPVVHEIKFRDGLPESTKVDNGYHGYGLKSIRHNVKKYEGYINIAIQNQCFDLKIMIPIPE